MKLCVRLRGLARCLESIEKVLPILLVDEAAKHRVLSYPIPFMIVCLPA